MPTAANRLEYDRDVETIVDSVVADPSRADIAKALLTRKIAAPDIVRVARVANVPSGPDRAEADEELWDNLPV